MTDFEPPAPFVPPSALQAKVEAALLSRGWAYLVKATEGGHRTRLVLEGADELWNITVEVWDALDAAVVRARPWLLAPSGRRTELALLLSRINEGLVLGNFEMDIDTGSVAFKASLDASTLGEVAVDAVEGLVDTVMRSCVTFFPAIQAVVEEGESADLAYAFLRAVDDAEETPGAPDPS